MLQQGKPAWSEQPEVTFRDCPSLSQAARSRIREYVSDTARWELNRGLVDPTAPPPEAGYREELTEPVCRELAPQSVPVVGR